MAQGGNEKQKNKIIWSLGAIACLVISVASVGFLSWITFGTGPVPPSAEILQEQSLFLIISSWIALIGAKIFRLAVVWKRLNKALESKHRPLREEHYNKAHKRVLEFGFKEHFLYMFAGLVMLCSIAFSADASIGVFNVIKITGSNGNVSPLHLILFISAFFSLFLPLLIGTFLYTHKESELLGREIIVKDAVSKSSFYVTLGIGVILGLFAWQAGENNFNFGENFGIYVTLVVILTFLSFVIAPHIARIWNNHQNIDDNGSNLPVAAGGFAVNGSGKEYPTIGSFLDSLMVRIVAPLTGATQQGRFFPHLIILMIVLPLSALGFMLSSPFGLVPIGFAMIMIYALGRRWAWVENDRETASRVQSTDYRNKDIRIGFDNDLKDEALLGYAAFFVLVPLALFQIDGFTPTFTEGSNKFQDWLRFFGAELAKAVPFVDWWEIYKVDVKSPMQINDTTPPLAKHLTFGARAMVDLVIMAALLQAINIWQRARAQYRLYDAGQINTFDPFLEESFFKKGMFKKGDEYFPSEEFELRLEKHAETRSEFGFTKIAYNERRLGELVHHEDDEVRAGANWIIDHFPVLVGPPREKIEQIANQWRNE